MVETITPVVHGGSRARWAVAVAMHAVSAAFVAGAFGAALGAAGGVLGAPWGGGGAVVVSVGAAWALAHEALGVPFPVPQLRRQVPDWWRTFFSPLASAALYGAALGVGFFTYLLQATLVVVAGAAFASGRPLQGALIVAPFGLARGLTTLAAVGGADAVHGLAAFARRRWPLAALNAGSLCAVAVAAGASARGPIGVRPLALAAIAVAFMWSAAWKLLRPAAWRSVVEGYGLGRLRHVAAFGAPMAETAVVALAIAGQGRASALLALLCLLAFTVAAIRRRIAIPGRVPCGCFGSSKTSLPALVARNAALASAAAVAAGSVDGLDPRIPAPSDVLPLALSFAGLTGVLIGVLAFRRCVGAGRG